MIIEDVNDILLRRFELQHGFDCENLIERRQRAHKELFDLEAKGAEKLSGMKDWCLTSLVPMALTILALTLWIVVIGTDRLTFWCCVYVFALYSVGHLLGFRIKGRLETALLREYEAKRDAATKRLNQAKEAAKEAEAYYALLKRLREVLGHKSDHKDKPELEIACGQWLSTASAGITKLSKSSMRTFGTRGSGPRIVQEFYDTWELFHKLELVSCSADTYIERARSKE